MGHEIIRRCRELARCTEEPGYTTRTFLSEPMREVHALVGSWMEGAGMAVSIDSAGNLRGRYPGVTANAKCLYLGSHLDTVPRAGAFDGVLGVVLSVALVERLEGRRLPFAIEVLGFSEEEGVRFGIPFIGSRAFIGKEVRDERVREAIRNFGLDSVPMRAPTDELGYLEFHIEQGPVLENLGRPLGIVEAIVGQSRVLVTFSGQANHAGTTPMPLRRDALAGAAEWIGAVEREARSTEALVATVGRCEAEPGAGNVIAGLVRASLDVRHRDDATRAQAVSRLLRCAEQIAERRGLSVSIERLLDQPAVAMDDDLTAFLERAAGHVGHEAFRMTSGAGHDAMIVAKAMPAAMLFLRSPGGVSHHPGECVLPEDVAAALEVGMRFLEELS